jgi:dihydropteroate synthase
MAGRHAGPDAAVARAREMVEEGADLIDIGGESTRPGAEEVPQAEEIARVRPVIEALAGEGRRADQPRHPKRRRGRGGSAAGADILNDVSGCGSTPPGRCGGRDGAPLILMHSIGTPETMQALAAAGAYDDVLLDVYDGLEAAVAQAEAAGVAGRGSSSIPASASARPTIRTAR